MRLVFAIENQTSWKSKLSRHYLVKISKNSDKFDIILDFIGRIVVSCLFSPPVSYLLSPDSSLTTTIFDFCRRSIKHWLASDRDSSPRTE
jgi:hypothetical protein